MQKHVTVITSTRVNAPSEEPITMTATLELSGHPGDGGDDVGADECVVGCKTGDGPSFSFGTRSSQSEALLE